MQRKTHLSALVLIPPTELWEPIQRLRRRYDRKVRRWMPHITLVYPFRPVELRGSVVPLVDQVCARWRPFTVTLRHMHLFHHGKHSHTVWLAPEPAEPLLALQQELAAAFPDCQEQNRYPTGFTPHLSLGQYYGSAADAERFRNELQQEWQPLSFTVDAVVWIARREPPEDIFQPVVVVPFGATSKECSQ